MKEVFGLPGDGINGIMEALRKRQDEIRLAAFMACAYAKYTGKLGVCLATSGTGFHIEEPSECGRILDEALSVPGPVVVEAVVDPHEPPMPPKITAQQELKFAEALARGTPNRTEIALTIASDKVREIV